MSETTTTDPPAELDPAKLDGWRATPLADLPGLGEAVRYVLELEEAETAGDVLDAHADGEADDNPFGLNPTQVAELRAAVEASLRTAGLDPAAVCPWLAADEPAVVIDPASPEALARYDSETARLVMQAEREVNGLEGEWEARHGEAAVAKKEFESARDKLRALIRQRDADRGKRDLFTAVDGNASPADAPAPAEDRLTELMMKYPLTFERWGKYGLTEKDLEKLTAGETKHHGTIPLYCYGDIGRFVKDPSTGFERRLTDIKGFGPAAYDRWLDAELKFQQDWPAVAAAYAAEIGFDLGTADASAAGPGAGDGAGGGDGDAEAGEVADATDAEPDLVERPPERLKPNPKTGELEPVGHVPKKRKAKAKGRGKGRGR